MYNMGDSIDKDDDFNAAFICMISATTLVNW